MKVKLNKKIILIIFVCFIFAIFGITIPKSLSRYTDSLDASGATSIAEFVVIDSLEDNIIIETEIDGVSEVEYYFSVANYDNDNQSKVNISYVLKVSSVFQVLPFEFELYDIDDLSTNLLDTSNVTNEVMMYYTNKDIDYYKLVVKLSSDDYIYQDLVDQIKIEIDAYQKVGD